MPAAPNPADGATGVSPTPTLTWTASGATTYDVQFGTTNPPSQVIVGQTNASYSPLSCWIQRAETAAPDCVRAACTASPISAAWCTTTAAVMSSSTKASSSADCRQFAAQK